MKRGRYRDAIKSFKAIVVKDAVKEVGSYKAIVKLHKEVSVEIPFEVVAE